MKHLYFILSVVLLTGWSLTVHAQTTWTISAANSSTQGGYALPTEGGSQYTESYDGTTWPSSGYLPTYFIHFPKASKALTITSNYASTIKATVVQMSTGTTVVSDKSANSFSFTPSAEGWYRLQLTGGTANSTALQDFTVTASRTTTLSGTNKNVWLANYRSVPSVHVSYWESSDANCPDTEDSDWIYNEVKVPSGYDYYGTYYMAIGWSGGYFGMQNNGGNDVSSGRTIIFSGWDNGDTDSDASLADYKRTGVIGTGEAETVVSTRFGGEGTGGSVRLTGSDLWTPGAWVKFLINSRPEEIQLSDGTSYQNTLMSAWYQTEGVDTDWHYVGTIRLSGTNKYFGYKSTGELYSFLEEYTRGGTSQGYMEHRAYYRRFATRNMLRGTWYNRNTVSFSRTDATTTSDGYRLDNLHEVVTLEGEPAVLMRSGGYAMSNSLASSTTETLVDASNYAPSDATLQRLIERDVLPAIQQQDEDRMETAIENAMTQIDQTEWTVTSYTSQEESGEGTTTIDGTQYNQGRAANIVDGLTGTYWHTTWWSGTGSNGYPQTFTLKHTDLSLVDIDRILINSGSRASSYLAKTVVVSTSTDGSTWTEVGTYTLGSSNTQYIDFEETLSTAYLKLSFTEPIESGQANMCIHELTFYQKSLASLKALAKTLLDNADQFNGYSSSDLAALQEVYDAAASTHSDFQTALTNLAENGSVLKYGVVPNVVSLSPEKAYVIRNKNGFGDMVCLSASDTYPTLRSVDASSVTAAGKTLASTSYTTATDVTSDFSNWMIVEATGDDAGYYYIYNIGTGKYLKHLSAGYATMSDDPYPFSIAYDSTNSYFTFHTKASTASTDYLCSAPQNGDGSALGYWTSSDEGSQWYIYDNYSVTPDASQVYDLRVAAGLASYVTLTWNVKDGDGNTYKTISEQVVSGSIVDELPSSVTALDEYFITFPDATPYITRQKVSAATTINVNTSYEMPFTPGGYYFVRLNGKLLSTEATDPLTLTTTSYNRASAKFPWKFVGTPYTGFQMIPYADDSTGLTRPSSATYGAAPTLSSSPSLWTIRRHPLSTAEGTFQIVDAGGSFALYDYGGNNVLKYWDSVDIGYGGNDTDVVTVSPVDVTDELLTSGFYRIANYGKSGYYLTTANNVFAAQNATTDKAQTIFRVEEQADARFRISKLGEYMTTIGYEYNTAPSVATSEDDAYISEVIALGDGKFAFSITDSWTNSGYTNFGFANLNTNGSSPIVLNWWATNDDSSAWLFEPVSAAADVTMALNTPAGATASYATAYMPYDYTVPANTRAYTITVSSDGKSVTATALPEGKVPAGTPVVLEYEDAVSSVTLVPGLVEVSDEAAEAIAANDLRGTYVDLATDGTGVYVLNQREGVPGFFPFAGTSLAAYKAWLLYENAQQAPEYLPLFGGTATDIHALLHGPETGTPAYDLQGRRVEQMQRGGVYIKDGRKILR